MKVVSDASVLIHMARIERFSLLRSLYGELTISTGVYLEVVEEGWGFPGSFETENAVRKGWLEVKGVTDKVKIAEFMRRYNISLGNAETVQLAVESRAELALADEAEVRYLLEEHSIITRGCIGVLIEAAKKGLISTEETKEDIRRLVDTGYRVSDKVLSQAYRLLSE